LILNHFHDLPSPLHGISCSVGIGHARSLEFAHL
jgi:hypothetical protein